jgi:hypothetical protein
MNNCSLIAANHIILLRNVICLDHILALTQLKFRAFSGFSTVISHDLYNILLFAPHHAKYTLSLYTSPNLKYALSVIVKAEPVPVEVSKAYHLAVFSDKKNM